MAKNAAQDDKATTAAESADAAGLNDQSSVKFDALLAASGISGDYTQGDVEEAAHKITNALAEQKRLAEDKAAGLGTVPDRYSFDLPQDFKSPDGQKWQPDENFTNSISEWAREAGIDQDKMSKLVVRYAQHQMNQMTAGKKQSDEARSAELGKLGPNGQDRIGAVMKAVAAHYGDDGAQALQQGGSARGIEILEDLLAAKNGTGNGAQQRGNGAEKPNLSQHVGKKGGGRKLLDIANKGR